MTHTFTEMSPALIAVDLLAVAAAFAAISWWTRGTGPFRWWVLGLDVSGGLVLFGLFYWLS